MLYKKYNKQNTTNQEDYKVSMYHFFKNLFNNLKKQADNQEIDNHDLSLIEKLAEPYFSCQKDPTRICTKDNINHNGIVYTYTFGSKEMTVEIHNKNIGSIEYKTFNYK